ncbi:MAG: hypothetical protein HeimC3_39460 [Candidatus Heimdallarchaeota archaeon LC_3]|nr:MAG: hypothetical protein HeimC3_39460 [Candidatus Heimdallarchaeota archaeon LC_3]
MTKDLKLINPAIAYFMTLYNEAGEKKNNKIRVIIFH